MKKLVLFSAILVSAAVASQAHAGGVNLHLGFNLPLPPLPGLVVTHSAPVYAPAPAFTTSAPCDTTTTPVYESSTACEQPVVTTTAPVYAPVPAPVIVAPAPVCAPQVVVAPRPVIITRPGPVIVQRPYYDHNNRGHDWNNHRVAWNNSHDNRWDGRDGRNANSNYGYRR